MMKRHLTIFNLAGLFARVWMAGLCAVHVRAAYITVPQSSAADYVFIRPHLTNHIQGVIADASSPSNTYRVIRSEDVDWLLEAFAERQCIMGGSTNGTVYGVGHRVEAGNIPSGSFWNGPMRGSDGTWLDPDTSLLSGMRLYGVGKAITNVVVTPVYTNAVTNAISVVTMPMTNGTVSVFTNRWTAYSSEKMLYRDETTTNVFYCTALDYCIPDSAEYFPGLTNVPMNSIWYGRIARMPRISEISNAWAALRATKRLADVGVRQTNAVSGIEVSKYAFRDGPSFPPSTNAVYNVRGYMLSAHTDTNGYWHATERRPVDGYSAILVTRFDNSLVLAGGVQRVALQAAYASCEISYWSYDYHRDPDLQLVQKIFTNAMVRIDGEMKFDGEKATVKLAPDMKALCSAVTAAAGGPGVPDAGVDHKPSAGYGQTWDLRVDTYVLIYSITPSVKLPDW